MDDKAFQKFAEQLSDRYRIERELGRGGWGVVYLAEDLRHRRAVAVKVLRVEVAGTAARDRFLREIEVEARLAHPHIVPLFDSGELDGVVYYVMPFITGESLQQRISREGALPVGDALRIARQVAEALAHAHSLKVVHRDIKPANILLSGTNALVADFGVARALDLAVTGEWNTSAGLQLGTPAYMAPEQAASDPAVDGRADIYSAGCVLYEMLSGKPPFDAPTPGGVMRRHALDPVPPLRTLRPGVSPALEAVIERALAKNPADRYQTADALWEGLEEVAVSEGSSGPHSRRVAPGRRRRKLQLAAVFTVAAIAGVSGVTSVRRASARARADADTTRIALFPLEGTAPAASDANERLRSAFTRWKGVQLVDPFEMRDAIGSGALSARRARDLALRFRAGRYIRGTVTNEDGSTALRVMLYDARNDGEMIDEASQTVASDSARRDSVFFHLADRLLLRASVPGGGSPRGPGTVSLPARQSYLRGRAAILRWDLAAADSAFRFSQEADPAFGEGALWLALTRYWSTPVLRPSTWRVAALAALRDSAGLDRREVTAAEALVAFADRDLARSCALWDALTRRASLEFWVWYSAATCRDRDKLVLRDDASPSGWRFRSSYHTALLFYLQAFQLMPAIHRALRDDAFEKVRRLLKTGGNDSRFGLSEDERDRFLAIPSLDGDTLVFVPYPYDRITVADPATERRRNQSSEAAVRRLREMFRDIATQWVATFPASAEAREALALSMQLLGDPAALDTLARAEALAGTEVERRRLSATRAWLQVKFALPDDQAKLRSARVLADAVLRNATKDEDPVARAGLAALTGRVAEAVRLDAMAHSSLRSTLPAPVAAPARTLLLYSSFAGPVDSLRRLARHVDSLVSALVPQSERHAALTEALGRSATLAFPAFTIRVPSSPDGDYLLAAQHAWQVGDSAALQRALGRLRATREVVPTSRVTFDGLLPEAELLAASGDLRGAAAWLDPAFIALRQAQPDFDPLKAAALVRAMALRAELAEKLGDRVAAARWAAAVVTLWSDADPFLEPLVRRMRKLMR